MKRLPQGRGLQRSPKMPTSFATTVLVLLVTTNNIGQLAAVDKKDLPSPYTNSMLVSLESCNFLQGSNGAPREIFLQVSTSPKTTSWTYTPLGEITPAEAAPAEPGIDDQGRSSLRLASSRTPPAWRAAILATVPATPASISLRQRSRHRRQRRWLSGHVTISKPCSRATRLPGSSVGEAGACCAREALRRTWPRCRPLSEPLRIRNWATKARHRGYGLRFSSCLISSVINRATSRSLSSPDLIPNFRRNLLPSSSDSAYARFVHDDETVLHPVVADDTHTSGLAARWPFPVDVIVLISSLMYSLLVEFGVSLFQIAREVRIPHVANTTRL